MPMPSSKSTGAASTGKTRLADIAKHAEVSTATVSRVLNGKPAVAAETRRAVLAALDVLGYERPENLQHRPLGPVGIVVPELTNPVFPAFAQAIESTLSQQGYTPILCTQSPGGVTEDEYVQMLLDQGTLGIVFVSGRHADTCAKPERYIDLRQRDVPIVLVNGYMSGIDAPFVSTDDATTIALSLRHLTSLGHRRIGLAIGPDRYVPARRKIDCFIEEAIHHGLAANEKEARQHVVVTLFTVEGGQAAAETLVDSGHTAIVCGSDLMALGVIRAIRARRLRVPADVSVIGYDDAPLMAFTDPPLTTVRQPILPMAQSAVSALLGEMAHTAVPRTELLFQPDLIVRASTGAAPPTS